MFEGKIALVTGGTSGIGKKIAESLIKEGAFVFINFHKDESHMYEVKKEFKQFSSNLEFIKADISNEEEVLKMMNKINEKKGHLNYLVNNAGMNIDAFIEEADMCLFKKVVDTNFIGKVITTKYALPLLKKGEHSAIVNIASRLGTMPCEEASAYCGAASAIINFTKLASLEFAKYKIWVNCVSPSLTTTPLALSGWTDEEIQEQTQNNPLGRLATTEDIANAVIFLLSDKASYINGQNINVNGGSLI